LPCDAEWPRAGLAYAARGKVKVDDGIALIRAGRRLVRALTEQRNGAGVSGKEGEELFELNV
jgi:hypothetical protein